MQLRIERKTLLIIPETEQDKAFIEDTMGLCEDGDVIQFERIDDDTPNWVSFKLESFPARETAEDVLTPTRVCKINASKYNRWDYESEEVTGTPVDPEVTE